MMVQESLEREHHTYTVRNQDSDARSIVIEHPPRQGWELAAGTKPEETSTSAYRFRMKADSEKTASLEFDEVHSFGTSYSISNITPDQIAMFIRQGWVNEKVENALHPILQQKDVVAEYAEKISSTSSKIKSIFDDQKRLRENVSALKSSTEERALLQRYSSELNREEDDLSSLRKELAQLQTKHEDANQKLNDMIEKLEMSVKL